MTARDEQTAPPRRIKIALVGCGAVARANLLPVIAGHDRLELVALVDRDETRARDLANAYQVPQVLTDLDKLPPGAVGGVVLATPPAHHAPATIALAERGVHVFVEKPMATSHADAEAMVAAADRAGITLGVGLYRRFLPSVQLVKALVERREFGAPLSIDIEEGGSYGWDLATLAVLTRAGGGGGVLMDIGTHLIDELLFMVPGRLDVHRFEDNARGGIETDCLMHGDLTTAHETIPVRLELSRTRDLRNSIRVACEHATLELGRADFTHVRIDRPATSGATAGTDRAIAFMAQWDKADEFVGYQAFRDQLDDWLGAIDRKTAPVLSGRSVVPVTRAIEDCYRLRTAIDEPWIDANLAAPTAPMVRAPAAPAPRRRVLVTGAGGFVGGRAVEILRERYGWDAVALVKSPRSAARLARWTGEIVLGDVCSADDMARAVQGCDAVVHCAVGTIWPPEASRVVTVEGTRTAADAARKAGVRRFVHISTLFVHRRDGGGTLDETTPLEPPASDDYGQAKLAAERALEGVAKAGLSTIVLRPTRIYGPFSKTFTVRPLQAIARGQFAIAGDAGVPANMVFVDNVVEAIARAIEAPEATLAAYLVTDPEQVSLREFYEHFARAAGRTVGSAPPVAPGGVGEDPGLVTRWLSGFRAIATSPELRGIVRKVIQTDPIGTWPRRFWDQSPEFQQKMLRRFGADAAVVYRPAGSGGDERLVYDGESARVSSTKAERELGFQPLADHDRAMALTLAWARYARLLG